MERVRQSRVVAWWASGRSGIAKSSSAPNVIHFTAPAEFGGLARPVDTRRTVDDGARQLLYYHVPHHRSIVKVRIHRLGWGASADSAMLRLCEMVPVDSDLGICPDYAVEFGSPADQVLRYSGGARC